MTTADSEDTRTAWYGWSSRRIAVLTFVLSSLVYVPTASLTFASSIDVQAAVVPAIAIAQTGSPWLESFDLPENPWFIEAGGHLVSNRPPILGLVSVPLYAVAGAPIAYWPAAVTAALLTALAVTFMHLALRSVVPARTAAVCTLVFALATPTWTVSADGPWGHTVTQLAIAGGLFFASRAQPWGIGAMLGLGILARPHVAVIALTVGLALGWRERSLRPVAAVGLPSAAGLAVLVLLNRWVFGRWTLTAYGEYVTNNLAGRGPSAVQGTTQDVVLQFLREGLDYLANVAGFLVSPDRGLFVWTPVLLLLLPAAWRARRHADTWVVAFALGGLAYSVVQLRINVFHGGSAFYGYRNGLEVLTCVTPLYALAWARTCSAIVRSVAVGLVTLQFAAALFGAVQSRGLLDSGEVWTGNSFAMALGQVPAAALLLLAIALGLSWRFSQGQHGVGGPQTQGLAGDSETADASGHPTTDPR